MHLKLTVLFLFISMPSIASITGVDFDSVPGKAGTRPLTVIQSDTWSFGSGLRANEGLFLESESGQKYCKVVSVEEGESIPDGYIIPTKKKSYVLPKVVIDVKLMIDIEGDLQNLKFSSKSFSSYHRIPFWKIHYYSFSDKQGNQWIRRK